MKILIVSNVSDRSEFTLYTELLKRGEQIDLVCNARETKVDSFRELGGKAYILNIKHRLDFRAVRFLRDLVTLYDYDIVYAPFNKGLATSALALIGRTAKLITYRGTLDNISYLNPVDYLTYLNSKVRAVACNCQAVRRSLAKYNIADEKLHAIYKGHDPLWYQSDKTAKRAELGIAPDTLVIGCIANVRPLKGIQILLEAFAKLSSEKATKLLLVGKASDSNITRLVECHPKKSDIEMLGFRSDASEIAGTFDVAVMPSLRREGLPRSIIESISQKVPAVVTDIGGMPELVINNKTGIVIKPNDSQELTTALQTLLHDSEKRKAFGEAGLIHLRNKFSVEEYIQAMLGLFRQTLAS